MACKKAQLDNIVGFVFVAVALLFLAPIMMLIFHTVGGSLSSHLGNVTTGGAVVAKANFDSVLNPLVSWWDKILVFVFIVLVLVLLFSSFFIDTHPVFVVLYIVVAMLLLLVSNGFLGSLSKIYNDAVFSGPDAYGLVVTNSIPFMNFLLNNFGYVLVGVFFLTGVVMFGKIGFFPHTGGGSIR